MNRKILAFLTAAMCFASAVPFNAIAENSVKGLEGLQEKGGSGSLISGEQSDGVYVDYYYKLSDISATAEADTAKLMIDKNYTSDTVSSSCTVKSLAKDLTIDAGDKDIIVLLDEAVLEKTMTVKADKGSVTFFIQGSLTCGKDSRGIVWHEICDGCKVTDDKYIPVTFYGSEDSAVTLTDEAILCGSLRLPYTVLDDRSTGAFKIEYVSESDNKHYMMKPTVIGNALLKKYVNGEGVFAYCAKKADSSELNGLTISKGTKQLTLSEVIPLAKKGDKITWSDFEPYAGDWHGIGMYTHVCNYDLGGGFFLLVEGNPPEEPAVVELYKDGYENRIDIRKDDIDEFMAWASDYYHASELDTAEKKMTLDDVISLSKKGNALDWEDFVIYSGQESGHGYTEWRFELEDGYTLRVMGESKEKAPEKITLYRNDQRKGLEEIDIRTDDVKAFLESKQYYFNEIGSMTKNELKALFAKKGLTEDKGYGVWTKEEVTAVLKDNTFTVCLKPDARFVTKDGTEVLNEASSVAELLKYDDYNITQANYLDFATKLPRDEISLFFSHAEIRTEKNEKGEYVYRRYFHYNFVSMYSDEETQIKKITTALNYLQLNPYLDSFNLIDKSSGYSGQGSSENNISYSIVKLPDKVVYKKGEQIDLKGIQIEVKKDGEEPVVYTYPDVAFDYQSNVPKSPTVTLSTDFRSDKAGTYKVEVVGTKNVSFSVEVVDDSTEKTQENSVMLTTESGDDGCYIHLDLMSGTFSMSGSIYQNFAVFGKFERKGNDLYLYAENGSTNVYVLHREDDYFISQSDEKGINLTKGLAFSAENDAFWEKLTSTNESTVKGDANCDGEVDMSDVVLVMQALANPNKYGLNGTAEHHLTAQGKLNGDMDGDGLTVGDAQAIQKKLLGITENEAPVIKLNTVIPQKGTEYVELKPYESMASSYDPVLSSLDGVGVWFEFQSEKYPLTLTADRGTFKTFTYKSGGIGTVNEVGSTYEVGKSGSVSWVPDDISIPISYEAKIKVTGNDNGKSVDLGTLVVSKNPNSSESAVFVTLQKPNTSASSQPFPKLSDIVTIDNDYLKNKAYQGIGISLEFDSKDYPIALTAAEGGFVVENTDSSTGMYKILGKTCEVGKSGMVILEPIENYMSYDYEFQFSPERLDIEVLVEAIDGDRRVELGKIYIAQVERTKFTASLDAKVVSPYRAVIADKTYVYEKEGVGSDFTITFYADGTYKYYEGVLSSYIGAGTWKVTDDTVIMTEGVSKKVNYLKIKGSDLIFIAEGSDNFYYITVKDGEKFSVKSAE